MRAVCLSLAVWVILPLGGRGAIPPLVEDPQEALSADPLAGKWVVYEGSVRRGQGVYFDPATRRRCGTVTFHNITSANRRLAIFTQEDPNSDAAPWGRYDSYRLSESGVLTLGRTDGPDIHCFLKYKAERRADPEVMDPLIKPLLCVFYEPARRRAFKVFRMSDLGNLDLASKPVFVPFEGVLPGRWKLLPGTPVSGGKLEFRLTGPPPPNAARLEVKIDNSVELETGGGQVHFRLRQYDPTHWAIESPTGLSASKGTLTMERDASRVIGGNVLLTRWQIGARTMTAVLLAEGSRRTPRVPVVRFEGTQPLDLNVLLAIGTTPEPGDEGTTDTGQ